ncbi:MAG: Hha/YmoA family nucleoid-associated regulatory protein [Symbiopectobacterium sp.]|uniref:Hha/YmoA family nucleoid-associated regulatory protein n=1 Tax=Symbiopectobacterium sp. TaxID=2952789 RepID=UPI003F3F84CE
MQPKSKIEWLRQLRRYSTPETVKKVADLIAERLDDNEYGYFQSAVDHRLAEWGMYGLYTLLPVEVWHSVK